MNILFVRRLTLRVQGTGVGRSPGLGLTKQGVYSSQANVRCGSKADVAAMSAAGGKRTCARSQADSCCPTTLQP